ncbi:MAG: dihydropteroate synthase [Sulfobacillus sp.]|nr:dihydropteroate synthase [Sulfobacillus sp.]
MSRQFNWGRGTWTFGQRIYVLGILNLTPDSFSDGHPANLDPEVILERARQMVEDGVDGFDVGAESTRPGYRPVPWQEEWDRLQTVLPRLREAFSHLPISVDTQKAEVAERALAAGADIINDVTGFTRPEMVAVAQASRAGLILMFNQDTVFPPGTVTIHHLTAFFQDQLDRMQAAGIASDRILIDPGLGFSYRGDDNWRILQDLAHLKGFGAGLLVGHSRKSFLGQVTGHAQPTDRDPATAALTAVVGTLGADVVRVHRVDWNRDAARVAEAWRQH